MEFKYNLEIECGAVQASLGRLTNQIYKLLPTREEGGNWSAALAIIMEELAGMNELFIDQQPILFKLLCKLEGLFILTDKEDFMLFRSVIFECLNLIGQLSKCLD